MMKTYFKLFRKKDLLYLTILFFVLLAGLHLFERSQVWRPGREITRFPDPAEISYEDVYFSSGDGVRLNGWYFPCPGQATASILFCHGNGGNISGQFARVHLLQPLGLNFFVFDYRGYGKSGGILTERGTYRDARAALEWLKERTPGLPVILHGWSLGAAVATGLATEADAAALISENGFTSTPNIGKDRFPFLPTRFLSLIRYNAESKIRNVHMPVLVIHSREDETVAYYHGERLFQAANEPKTMTILAGGHDCAFVSENEYKQTIQEFLQQRVLNRMQKRGNHNRE